MFCLPAVPARTPACAYCTFPSTLRAALHSGAPGVANGPHMLALQVSERGGAPWPVLMKPRLHCQLPANRSRAVPAAMVHAGYHCDGHSKYCARLVATGSSSLAGQQRMPGFGGHFETSHVVSKQC